MCVDGGAALGSLAKMQFSFLSLPPSYFSSVPVAASEMGEGFLPFSHLLAQTGVKEKMVETLAHTQQFPSSFSPFRERKNKPDGARINTRGEKDGNG